MKSAAADAAPLAPAPGPTLFGQPRGLATLFLTEMWERFTYYGIQAILILFMVAAVSRGGLGLDDRTSSSIFGLFLGSTYLLGLFGGWIADRLLGAQRAVISGGILIAAGSILLAIGNHAIFFLGLLVNAMGVGLLKPNVSAIVASLYPEGGARRDAGFSIFYMGINSGALLGSFFVPLCAAAFGWRVGFALPALFMTLGVAQFLAAVALIVILALTGIVTLDAAVLVRAASWGYGLLALAYFVYLLFFAGLTAVERKRALVMVALFVASAIFWAGYFQQGGSFNLFAERYTDRHIFGWDMPAGVLQAVNPFFVITLAGVFAALWLALGKRGRDPLASTKFGVALILLGLGFLVMYFAAQHVLAGQLVLPTWLVLTYFLNTCGELCLSPVGLSYMSKLAPPRFVGQAMGIFFLSLALGGNLAGVLTGQYDASHLESLPGLFLKIFWYGVIAGAVMLLLTPAVKKLMAGVH